MTETGQIFRTAMHHENHPDKDYEMTNRVEVFDPPRAIAWKPGQSSPETGEVGFGGWVWRYDLEVAELARRQLSVLVLWSDDDRLIPLTAIDTFCSTFGTDGHVVHGGHS